MEALEAAHRPTASIEEMLDALESRDRAEKEGADRNTLDMLDNRAEEVCARLPASTRELLERTPEGEPFAWGDAPRWA
jgi:hypothetical protein